MKKILCACEESQAVCKAFRELGFEAYSADLIPCSGDHPEWHIQGDVIPLIDGDVSFTTMDGVSHEVKGKWDAIIAFPPCTYLSNAGACRLYPHKGQIDEERFQKGLKAKEFFLKFLNADCEHIAVENPVSCKVFTMPEHTQEIQPYEFDDFEMHPYTKKTRLWLKGLPELIPSTPERKPVGPYVPAGTGRKDRTKYGAAKRGDDAKNRAKTFDGIAYQMAKQWGAFVRQF